MTLFTFLGVVLMLFVLTAGKKPKYCEDTLKAQYGEVIFSSIVFRFGARNELTTFPTDPYAEYFARVGYGQLTNAGKRQSYELGVWARERYANILNGKSCSPYLVNASSTAKDASINAAELFLAGFCPPKLKSEKWSEKLGCLWQPIPVHAIPKDEDNLLYLTAYCARYDLEAALLTKSLEIAQVFNKYNATFTYLREQSQKLQISPYDGLLAIAYSFGVCDDLGVELQVGLEQPEWAKRVYPEPCTSIEELYFKYLVFNDITKRLKAGPLIKNIIHDMTSKRNNATEYSKVFQIYSGLDTTIAVLLKSLDVFDGTFPPYSSVVLIELRLKNGSYIVTVSYRKSEQEAPALLELPNCKNPCTLDGFIEATKPLIPENWNEECYRLVPDYNTQIFE